MVSLLSIYWLVFCFYCRGDSKRGPLKITMWVNKSKRKSLHLLERELKMPLLIKWKLPTTFQSLWTVRTPDVSHSEQLSVTLHIVDCATSVGTSISEHFVGFLKVDDTTGKKLCDSLLKHFTKLKLDIADCRWQSHDNGSNMQGHKQGVQKRVLEINKKALCVPCRSHTLNLVIVDAAQSSVLSVIFLGVLQWLCNLFSSSVKCWSILQEHVKQLTVKGLLTIRWRCHNDSVKALRYQKADIFEALSGTGGVCCGEKRW